MKGTTIMETDNYIRLTLWTVSITAWMDEERKIDKPYEYNVRAVRKHTAVHRAMMAFDKQIGRHYQFAKLASNVERAVSGEYTDETRW
jgi:hypothetical protein